MRELIISQKIDITFPFRENKYTVGDEVAIIEPGTLFWFNNKLPHKAVNIGDNVRITFVFDIPHHKKNL